MKFQSPRLRRSLGAAGATAGLLVLAACFGGGGNEGGDDVAARPEDVDRDAPATVTEREQNAFRAPADSSLTPQQVEAYIKTSLTQFDLIRSEAPKLHARVAEMEKRGEKGGLISGLRNAAAGGQLMMQTADLIGGSFVRSARALGYNPAEMEYVRERMGEVSGYLIAKPMLEQQGSMAQTIRQQAEAMRGQPGFDEAQIQQMLQSADEMEKSAKEGGDVARSTLANYQVLRRFRPNVTDAMWLNVGIAGGASGLLGLSGLSDPNDADAQKKLDEYRAVFTDALANKVTPGTEPTPAPASN